MPHAASACPIKIKWITPRSRVRSYWHAGRLYQPIDSNAEELSQALCKGYVEKGDRITLTLDLKDEKGRLSVDVNGTNLGQLARDIDYASGMLWFAELCGGESIRVEMATSDGLV
jgi:hypothetical protein